MAENGSNVSIVSTAIDCMKNNKSIFRTIKELGINFIVDKTMASIEITLDERNYSQNDLEIFDSTLYDMVKEKYPKAISESDYKNILERFITKRKILLPGDYLIKLDGGSVLEILKREDTDPYINYYTLRVIGVDKEKKLRDILNKLQESIKKSQTKGSKIFRTDTGSTTNDRKIDNIFIPNKKEIIEFIDNWKESEDIYHKIFIPYKTGLIFYGTPGTGKTTFACAIGNYLNYNVYFLSPEDIIDKEFVYPRSEKDKGIVLIIDEIDNWINTDHSIKRGYGRNTRTEVEKLDLRSFREYIDNIPDKSVVIATTNHIEALDSSLLRAGRFDKHFEFKNIDEKIAKEMVSYHGLPESILDSFPDKNNINPAELEKTIITEKLKLAGVDQSDLIE